MRLRYCDGKDIFPPHENKRRRKKIFLIKQLAKHLILSQGWLIKRTVQNEPFVTKFPFVLTNLVFGKVVGEWPKYVYTHTNNVPLFLTDRKKKINKNSLSFICCHVWSKTGHYSSDCQNNPKKEGNLARYLEKPLSETWLISVSGEVNRRKIILMFVKRHFFIRPLKDWGRTMCCECPSLSVCRRNGLRVIRIVIDDKGNNKITELRTILQRESQNS